MCKGGAAVCRSWKACRSSQAKVKSHPVGIWIGKRSQLSSTVAAASFLTPLESLTPLPPGCAFPQCAACFAGPKAWPGGMGLISFFAVTVFLQALVADISTKV